MMRREQMQSLKIRKPDGRPEKPRSQPAYVNAILAGVKKYTDLRAPVRAIFAVPHDLGPAVGAYIGRLQTLGPATELQR
jgi:hypothetical protein